MTDDSEPVTLTLRFRLRDKHARELNRQARAVNYVWNYCNETQQKAARAKRKWLSSVDLQKLTAGSSKDLDLHAHTITGVCKQYDRSRKQHKKAWLRWRTRKSLGWVPFNTGHVSLNAGKFKFRGVAYQPMHVRDIPVGATFGAGSFNQDSRGHWYINVPVEFPDNHFARCGNNSVGVDLGLKELAVMSDGSSVPALQHYRQHEVRLGRAQRARKRKQVRNIAAHVASCRKDQLHKASARMALEYGFIAVGNVSSVKLSRTKMAKSVLDAGWSTFKAQLSYKAIRHGGIFIEVNEAYTSQTCSSCGIMPEGRPKGIVGLSIREWTCSDCGTVHDRDVNAARNILRVGLDTLAVGAPS